MISRICRLSLGYLLILLIQIQQGLAAFPVPVSQPAQIQGERSQGQWSYFGGAMYFRNLTLGSDGVTVWGATNRGLVRFDPTGPKLERWTALDGLADTWVYDVALDRYSRLWVATFSGLSRFDGNTFNNWRADAIGHHRLSCIELDTHQRPWVGTTGRRPNGAACLIKNRFARYNTQDNDEEFPDEIDVIASDGAGGVWVAGSFGRGAPGVMGAAGYYRRDRTVLYHISALGAFQAVSLPEKFDAKQRITDMAIDSRGRLLLAVSKGLLIRENDKWSSVAESARTIAFDQHNHTWLLTADSLGQLNKDDSFTAKHTLPKMLQKPLAGHQTHAPAMVIDHAGRITIAPHRDPGLLILANGKWTHYQPEIDGPSPPTGLSVWYIAQDGKGNMHFAGNRVGHVVYNGSAWQQKGKERTPYRFGYNREQRYIGVSDGEQVLLTDGRRIHLKALGIKGRSIYLDTRGHLWVFGNGLYEIDGDRVIDHTHDQPLMARPGPYPGGYGGLNLRDVGQSADGTLYVCANWGLFKWNGGRDWPFVGGKLQGMLGSFGWHSRINGNDRAIFCGSWGVSEYDFPTGRWFNFVRHDRNLPGAEPVLPGSYVENCGFDSRGNTWYGTYEGGVAMFDRATSTWRYYDVNDGLACNSVWGIGYDRDGGVWFGTPGGVSRFQTKSGVSK